MKKSNKYKLEKLGMYWHILEAKYVGWFIFKRKQWISLFPYYYYKEEAEKAFKKILNSNGNGYD